MGNYSKNYIKIYFWKVISIVSGFLSLLIVVPHLSNDIELYGIYSFCISFSLYLSYATIDPTHVNFFGVNWFNYFDPKHKFQQKMQYSTAKMSVKSITFDREWLFPKSHGFFHGLLIKFANKYPYKYEARLSHILPLSSLTFNLEIIK